jgi:hypothetical protein
VTRRRRNYLIERAREGLWGLAVVLVLLAATIAGGAWLQGRAYDAGAAEARERTARFDRLYEHRLQRLDSINYRAPDVKKAVDLVSGLAVALPQDPGSSMAAVGAVLNDHPRVRLDSLRWELAAPRDKVLTQSDQIAPATTRLARRALGGETLHRHMRLSGKVVDFGGDYRRAKQLFEGFVEALRGSSALHDVTVVEAPFDLDPDSGISGQSGGEARRTQRAAFILQLRHASRDAAD